MNIIEFSIEFQLNFEHNIYTRGGKVSSLVESIHITIFIIRSHMYHDNYMSIKNKKHGFNFNGFNQNSTISLNLVCFMTKMNITMTIIEVPAGQFNELIIKCTLACLMSAILELSFLVKLDQFLAVGCFEKK